MYALALQTPSASKPTKVNQTTIPNTNRLSAPLMSVDEGEGSELRSNEQDIAVLTPIENTLENHWIGLL